MISTETCILNFVFFSKGRNLSLQPVLQLNTMAIWLTFLLEPLVLPLYKRSSKCFFLAHSGDPALEPGAKSSDSGGSSTGFPTQTQEPGTAKQGHKPGTPEADDETLGESKP